MDLVSRLRQYIDHIAMPVTQFADTCAIPRPTMSQLLGGRNKKVSNELITKIHDAFPDLNVLWLMFGQGDMIVAENIAAIKPQNSGSEHESDIKQPDNKQIGELVLNLDECSRDSAEKCEEPLSSAAGSDEAPNDDSLDKSPSADATPVTHVSQSVARFESMNHSEAKGSPSKRIVNIIVYYSDNSFEAFIPEHP